MTIPQFQGHLRPLLLPLCDCVVQELQRLTRGLHSALKEPSSEQNLALASSESVAIMFLSALERIVTLALGHFPARQQEAEGAGSVDQGAGLFNYVSNVFSTEEAPSSKAPDGLMVRLSCPCFSLFDVADLLPFLSSLGRQVSNASPTPFEVSKLSGPSQTAAARRPPRRPRKVCSSSARGRAPVVSRSWNTSTGYTPSRLFRLWQSAGQREMLRWRYASLPLLSSFFETANSRSARSDRSPRQHQLL